MAEDLNYNKAFKNLKNYDDKIGALTLTLYNQVNDTLKELIVDNDVGLREAQRKLLKEYEKALDSTDFVENFKKGTVRTIVNSSFLVDQPAPTKKAFSEYLWTKSLFDDKITLSKRIRKNSALIVRDQKRVLRKALKEGKTIAQIVGNIGQDTLEGFTRELPKYIDDLNKARIAGAKLTQKQIAAVRKQAKRIKTPGLKSDYLRLIDAIELGKNIDKQVYFAMERRTKFYANRVARSETIRTMAVTRNHVAMQDEDVTLVKNITQGSNPCPYCISTENLGFVPVENATISTHHTNCSCRAEYKKTIKKPKKWSNDTFKSRLQSEINKQNAMAESKGRPKTYIKPETPKNLRTNDLFKNYPES